MNVIESFTIKTLKVHRKWTVVTIIGIIISTAMLTAVTTFSASYLDLGRRQIIQDSGKWMACFRDVPVADAEKLADSPLCSSLMIRKDLGFSPLPDSKNIWKPYLMIRQYDKEAIDHFHVHLVSGRLPANDREIILSSEVADNAGVYHAIGDTLSLDVSDRFSPTGEKLTPDISYQTMYYQYNDLTGENVELGTEYLVPLFHREYTIVGFFTTTLSDVSWEADYTCITGMPDSVAGAADTADLYLWSDSVSSGYYSQVRDLGKSMGYSADQITFNDSLMYYYAGVDSIAMQQSLIILAGIIISIIMAASISLIYNAFSISVSERTRHLGLLASAGATRRQKRHHVLFEGFLVASIAIPLGILFGIIGMRLTFLAVTPIMEKASMVRGSMEMHAIVSFQTLLIISILSSITVLVSVLIPAFRASRITPIDAIRQAKEIHLTKRRVRTHPIIRKIFGFEAELAMKNVRRNRRKYRATIVSLVISLVLFLTVSSYVQFGIMSSINTQNAFTYDMFISFQGVSDEVLAKIRTQIAALPDTEKIIRSESHVMALSLKDNDLTDMTKNLGYSPEGMSGIVLAYDDEDFTDYAISIGVNPKDYFDADHPEAILINHASETNYATGKKVVGDVLHIREGALLTAIFSEAADYSAKTDGTVYSEAAVNTKDDGMDARKDLPKVDISIGKITETLPVGGQNFGFSSVNMILPVSTYNALVAKAGIRDTVMKPSSAFYIVAKDSHALELAIADIVKIVPSSQVYYYNVTGANESNENSLLLMSIFVYGFITLISLICIANIFNTITTNVNLRQKEFAMLRSVGMTPKSFNRMIRFESIFYGCKALALGLPISILIAYILYRNESSMFFFQFTLPWTSYLAAVVLVFAVVFSTMLYAVSRVNKQNIIDSLKIDTM